MRSRSGLFQGRYLFHLHTVATDGALAVEDYFRFAREAQYQHLIFLEHIRTCPLYDVDAFAAAVREAAARYSVRASVGFEAKVLPDNTLDISAAHFRMADVIGIAEHGFRGGPDQLVHALECCFARYSQESGPAELVWVHPGLGFQKKGVLEKEHGRYASLLQRAQEQGILIESNLRYGLCKSAIYNSLPADAKVIGLDCHTMNDLTSKVCC